jgi:spermidine/putrescine transport system permease protein
VVTTALAIPASIALARRRFFGKAAISGALMAPLVIPLVVLGTSLLILFNLLGFPFGSLTIVIAHVVITIPFAILTIVPRLERIPSALDEAARDLGATWWVAFRSVMLPLLLPAVISAFLIAFTISFDEIVLADFVGGRVTTFPRYVWGQMRLPRQLPQVIAVAVVVLVTSTIVILISEIIRRRADRHLEASTQVSEPDTVPSVAGTQVT